MNPSGLSVIETRLEDTTHRLYRALLRLKQTQRDADEECVQLNSAIDALAERLSCEQRTEGDLVRARTQEQENLSILSIRRQSLQERVKHLDNQVRTQTVKNEQLRSDIERLKNEAQAEHTKVIQLETAVSEATAQLADLEEQKRDLEMHLFCRSPAAAPPVHGKREEEEPEDDTTAGGGIGVDLISSLIDKIHVREEQESISKSPSDVRMHLKPASPIPQDSEGSGAEQEESEDEGVEVEEEGNQLFTSEEEAEEQEEEEADEEEEEEEEEQEEEEEEEEEEQEEEEQEEEDEEEDGLDLSRMTSKNYLKETSVPTESRKRSRPQINERLIREAIMNPSKLESLPDSAHLSMAILGLEKELPTFESKLTLKQLANICDKTNSLTSKGLKRKDDIRKALVRWASTHT